MAQRVRVDLVDDVDGSPAEESVNFALDGVNYVIDLSAENASKLRDALSLWVDHARRTGGRRQKIRGDSARSRAPSPHSVGTRHYRHNCR